MENRPTGGNFNPYICLRVMSIILTVGLSIPSICVGAISNDNGSDTLFRVMKTITIVSGCTILTFGWSFERYLYNVKHNPNKILKLRIYILGMIITSLAFLMMLAPAILNYIYYADIYFSTLSAYITTYAMLIYVTILVAITVLLAFIIPCKKFDRWGA